MPNINKTFGLIECDIRPTERLIHDPLVSVESCKLMESLKPRFKEVFTSVELNVAIKHGYVIDCVYRIDHYQKSRKIFKTYIDKYMRVKQEYSKKPLSDSDTADQRETMGWVPEHKGFNAGMRQIAAYAQFSLGEMR